MNPARRRDKSGKTSKIMSVPYDRSRGVESGTLGFDVINSILGCLLHEVSPPVSESQPSGRVEFVRAFTIQFLLQFVRIFTERDHHQEVRNSVLVLQQLRMTSPRIVRSWVRFTALSPLSLESRNLKSRSLESRSLEAQSLEARSLQARSLEARSLEPRQVAMVTSRHLPQ